MAWTKIVSEIRRGDDSGEEALYEAVITCARLQLLHSVEPAAVDDYVQEVLIIVLQAIRSGELRDPDSLMGFVRTVARRQVSVHIRNAVLCRSRLTSVEVTASPAAPKRESPEARLQYQEQICALWHALGMLSFRDREILVRFYFDEQDSGEICEEMQLTANQFRLYKSRALAKCGKLTTCGVRPHSTRPARIA